MPRSVRPRLLALLASPRRRGENARLLTAFTRAARGWRVRREFLAGLSIAPYSGRARRADDEMTRLVAEFDRADALVLASPVYFYGFPAQTKAVIDRCQPLWRDPAWRTRPRRPAFFIATCAAPRLREFEVIIREAKAFLHTLGFEYCGELLVPDRDRIDPGGARLARACARAAALGARLGTPPSRKSPRHG